MTTVMLLNRALVMACLGWLSCSSGRAEEPSDVDLAAIGPQSQVLAPQLKAEIVGARIGWQTSDIRAAFRQAAEDGKPVIVVADGNDGGLFANVLRCPSFNTLAGQAHFVLMLLPIVDENSDAARLVNALHIDPAFKSTITVLATTDQRLNEVARLTGYQREGDILARLSKTGFVVNALNPLPLAKVALGGQPPRDCAR